MKTFLFLLVINIFSQSITSDIRNSSESNSDIVKAYRLKDVEKVMDFYSDTLYYEHMLSSQKKIIFNGKSDLRNDYVSHLGETRNVKIILLNVLEKQNILVAEYSIQREIISTGKTEDRKIVSWYEFDSSGKIKRMIDYL